MSAPSVRREKITVRISPERMRRARKAVKFGHAPSISAWVEQALLNYDCNFGWCETKEEAFEEWVREQDPPLTEEELAWARERVFRDI